VLPFLGWMLHHAGDPQAVGSSNTNWRLTKSPAGCASGVADEASVASRPVGDLDAGLAHQPGDPLDVHRHAVPEHELGVHPGRAVGATQFGMNPLDMFQERLVILMARGVEPRQRLLVFRPRHVQHSAGPP
jgi:hypothetical protein